MSTRTLIASLLLALGITAFEVTALQGTTRKIWTLAIPPIVGALALAGGFVLLVTGAARPAVPVIATRK